MRKLRTRTCARLSTPPGVRLCLSICEWGTAKPWLWGKEVGGNLWRTTGDIQDRWGGQEKWPDGSCCSNGVLAILDQQAALQSYAGPGHWNDPDMLEVGNGGMTDMEYRSHFSLWALLAAPLIAGNDLRNMRPEIHDILTNKEVIAVDQDAMGRKASASLRTATWKSGRKQLKDGGRAVMLLNRGAERAADHSELGGSRLSQHPQRVGARFVAAQGSGKVYGEIFGSRCFAWRGDDYGETINNLNHEEHEGSRRKSPVRGETGQGCLFNSSITLWINSFASVRLFMMI